MNDLVAQKEYFSTAGDSVTAAPLPIATALIWIERAPRAFNETLTVLLKMKGVGNIYVGFAEAVNADAIVVRDPRIRILTTQNIVAAGEEVFREPGELMLCITSPVRPSLNALDLANVWMESDPRIGTVSFLSNAAGYISFPHRNTETPFGVEGHDETSLTNLLRANKPRHWGPAPLPVPEGAMVLINRSLWDICGGFDDSGTGNFSFALVDLALRGSRRGFNNFLDPFTFVTVPYDGVGGFHSVLKNPEARHALNQRFPPFPAIHDVERDRSNSLLGQTLDGARAKAQGLRILLDGSALGPKEMGTQTLIVNLTRALAQRSDVQWVAVGVPDRNNIPYYAHDLVSMRKVRFVPVGNLDFPEGPHADVIHRPFQPTGPIPWERWAELAKRSVITIQDLIAYRNVFYFPEWAEWDTYRDNFNRQVAHCDGVFSISHDVVTAIREEKLPIDDRRVFVVENGIDARSKDQPARVPDEILRRGWGASPFVMVLGATYAHKNRDAAIRVWSSLRQKGFKHKLILVGASVPHGSTRVEEALLTSQDVVENMLVLPEVSSEERNWLQINSSLVFYLTSAEGFGLVPFEAARMDVPTLFVSFGPLRELIDDPGLPTSYNLEGLTHRAEQLLTDPAIAGASIRHTLKKLGTLNWDETARKSVEAYFNILSLPSHIFRI